MFKQCFSVLKHVFAVLFKQSTVFVNRRRRSLKIDVAMQTDDLAIGGTHLNICAILSKLDKHSKALQHALCALELIGRRLQVAYGAPGEDYATLAIAYHNVAVEREFLRSWDSAAAA